MQLSFLPAELIINILAYLPYQYMLSLALTNNRMYYLVKYYIESILKLNLSLDIFKPKLLVKSNKQLVYLCIKNGDISTGLDVLNNYLSNNKINNLEQAIPIRLLLYLGKIKNLHLPRVICEIITSYFGDHWDKIVSSRVFHYVYLKSGINYGIRYIEDEKLDLLDYLLIVDIRPDRLIKWSKRLLYNNLGDKIYCLIKYITISGRLDCFISMIRILPVDLLPVFHYHILDEGHEDWLQLVQRYFDI